MKLNHLKLNQVIGNHKIHKPNNLNLSYIILDLNNHFIKSAQFQQIFVIISSCHSCYISVKKHHTVCYVTVTVRS